MPLVYIHGVGTRKDSAYEKWEKARNVFFSERILEPLGLGSVEDILNPYWGDFGAKFRWDHAYHPLGSEERLGPADEQLVTILLDAGIDVTAPGDELILRAAKHDLLQAIDAVWASSVEETTTAEELEDLATAGLAVLDYLDEQLPDLDDRISASALPWFQEVNKDEEFIVRLLDESEKTTSGAPSGEEFLGRKGPSPLAGNALYQGLQRIGRMPADVMARPTGWLVREFGQESIEMLVGDVAWYFEQRGTKDDPGPINQVVIDDLKAARVINSKPLIVVTHSMGGNIAYDTLSWYLPDFEVDLLVTVGSQVGYFEEIGLFRKTSSGSLKLAKPNNIKRWINISDRSDLLGYSASRIYSGVQDYEYDTGAGLLTAHSSYFEQLSFFRRLRRRVADAISKS